MSKRFAGVFLFAPLWLGAVPCFAVDNAVDDSWHFKVTPYLLTASLNGKVGIGPVVTDIDASFSDVLDHLDMAFMMFATARKGRWVLGLDSQYFKVSGLGSDTVEGPFGRITIDGTVQLAAPQVIVQPTLGYRLFGGEGPVFDGYVAARYTSIENEVSITATSTLPSFPGGARSIDGDMSWWDPVVGMRATGPITERLSGVFLADFGGFGVGSDVTYQWLAALGWNFTQLFSVNVGYRYFKQDFEEDRNSWNMAMQGVIVGMGFEF